MNYREKYIVLTQALIKVRRDASIYCDEVEDLFCDHLDYLWYKCLSKEDRDFIREYKFELT
jgi:hypothetical protein